MGAQHEVILEQHRLHAEVYEMDVCRLDLGRRFDMVIIPFHSFAHILSPADQKRALVRIREHLVPGGTFSRWSHFTAIMHTRRLMRIPARIGSG